MAGSELNLKPTASVRSLSLVDGFAVTFAKISGFISLPALHGCAFTYVRPAQVKYSTLGLMQTVLFDSSVSVHSIQSICSTRFDIGTRDSWVSPLGYSGLRVLTLLVWISGRTKSCRMDRSCSDNCHIRWSHITHHPWLPTRGWHRTGLESGPRRPETQSFWVSAN